MCGELFNMELMFLVRNILFLFIAMIHSMKFDVFFCYLRDVGSQGDLILPVSFNKLCMIESVLPSSRLLPVGGAANIEKKEMRMSNVKR